MEENKQVIRDDMVTVEVTSSEKRKFTGYKDSYGYEIYVGDELCIWQAHVVYEGTVKLLGNKYYYVGHKKFDGEVVWHPISYLLSCFMNKGYNIANTSNPNVKVEINEEKDDLILRLIVFGLFGFLIYLFAALF